MLDPRMALLLALLLGACTHARVEDPSALSAAPKGELILEAKDGDTTVRAFHAGTVRTYDVRGRTAREIGASMEANGFREGQGVWYGWTNFDLAYSFRAENRLGGCRVAEVEVLLKTEMVLPRWSRVPGYLRLGKAWDAFVGALEEHESGHVRVAVETARDFATRALREGDHPRCGDVHVAMRALHGVAISSGRLAQRTFDDLSDHGRKTGAVWRVARRR